VNRTNEIREMITKVLKESAYLNMHGVTMGSAIDVLADKAASNINARYILEIKHPFNRIELEKDIVYHKQQLAIDYHYLKKLAKPEPTEPVEEQFDLFKEEK
jgi:hypothetical protein